MTRTVFMPAAFWMTSGVTAIALGFWVARSGITGTTAFVAVMLAFIAALVVTVRLEYARSHDALSVLIVAAAFFTIAFVAGGLSAWLNPTATHPSSFDRDDVLVATFLACLAWVLFSVGYLTDLLGTVRALVGTPRRLAPNYPAAGVAALLATGWLSRLVLYRQDRYFHVTEANTARDGATWFLDTFSRLPLLCTALVLIQATQRRDHHARRARPLAALLLLGELAWALPTGSRTRLVALVALVVIVRYYAARKLPSLIGATLAIAVIVFVVFPLGAAYRAHDYRASVGAALGDSVSEVVQSGREDSFAGGSTTLARFSDAAALARVIHEGRGRMNFSYTDTLILSAQGFVPRAIYPAKRDPGIGNDFGRAYGIIASTNHSTSIAITQPGEIYLGGGLLGLILGMPLLGALYRGFNDVFEGRRDDPGLLAVYALVLPSLAFGLETSIAVGFVGAIKLALVLLLISGFTFRIIDLRGRAKTVPLL